MVAPLAAWTVKPRRKWNRATYLDIHGMHLGDISRSRPEELNSVSIADRVNRLVDRFTELQTSMDRHIAEYLSTKDTSVKTTYADTVTGNSGIVSKATLRDTGGISGRTSTAVNDGTDSLPAPTETPGPS